MTVPNLDLAGASSLTYELHGGYRQTVRWTGRGAPVVFLHGISRIAPDDPFVAALARRRTVAAPVTPGYDEGCGPLDLRDVHDLALHYDSLLEALGLDRVALVGHSFGAMIAAEIAAHVPRRVGRLVLIAPIGLWNDAYPVADIMARPYPEIDDLLWQGAAERPAAKAGAEPDAAERIERAVALANGLATVARYTWPIPDKGLRRRLHRIAAPTLALFGAGDAYVPARYAEDFAAGIRRIERRVVPGSHMLPYERPEALATEILDFLEAG